PAGWDLRLRPGEVATAELALAPVRGRRFVAVNCGGKAPHKDWGDDNWRALLELMFARDPDLALVFFGSADELDRADALAEHWPGLCLNLCGRLAPRESAASIRRASLFIGHDSGPLHLAAAMGVPCVGMFGNANAPKWWHPVGDQHRIVHDMRGVRHIAPAEVDAAVRRLAAPFGATIAA